MEKTTKSDQSFRKFSVFLCAGLGLWSTYVAVTWLTSSHPWGAIYSAIFAAFFLWLSYTNWKFESPSARGQGWGFELFGAVAAVGIATLWLIAETTNDPEYREQAVGFSIWGGFIAFGGLVLGSMWIHPKTRARVRALKRGEIEEYLRSRNKDD
ncbi:hypothetical protein [Aeromicrobium sp.]|uniref:hypothetical protein n=1 Tax=Aeromicrobium sp. TaxID=1871063 RepID=UPI002FCC1377